MVDNLIANIRHDAQVYWLSWRTQFKAATHLRGAFILQVVGMIVNNIGLLLAWLFLFERFGTINGWGAMEFIGMQGINMTIFGIVALLNSGFMELPRYVDQGSFDTFLTKPSSILAQISSSTIEIATIGDLALGLGLIVWYAFYVHVTLAAVGMFLLATLLGVLLYWCFALWPYILAFYLFDSDRISRNISFFFLDSGIYPAGVISGPLRTVLLTVWPGLFIGAIQLDILRGIGWEYLLLGVGIVAVWLTFTLWLFKRALRRYESANLIGAR